MPVFNNALAGAAGSGGAAGYKIERSLRFNDDDSAYLNKTPSSAGNRKTWTWSGWVKRSSFGSRQHVFGAVTSGAIFGSFEFNGNDKLRFYDNTLGDSNAIVFETERVFRDPSAWYHIVVALDSTAGTNTERIKLYVNGVQETSFSTGPTVASNGEGLTNSTAGHNIGSWTPASSSLNLDAYLAEVQFLDGLTPGTATDDANGSVTGTPNAEYLTDFGEFDEETGVWNPIEYSGTYGTNGFKLDFSTSNLGDDSSGNSNNWTVNNLLFTSPAAETSTITSISGNVLTFTDNTDLEYFVAGDEVGTVTTSNAFSSGAGSSPNGAVASTSSATDYITNGNAYIQTQTYSGTLEWWFGANYATGEGFPTVQGDEFRQNDPSGFNFNYCRVNWSDGTYTSATLNNNVWSLPTNGKTVRGVSINFNKNIGNGERISWDAFDIVDSNGNAKTLPIYGKGPAAVVSVSPSTSQMTVETGDWATGTTLTKDAVLGDNFLDTPTNYEASSGNNGGNYATWNPLQKYAAITLSNGNLDFTDSNSVNGGDQGVHATIAPVSGKFYWELTLSALASENYIGISKTDKLTQTLWTGGAVDGYYYYNNGKKIGGGNGNGGETYGASFGAGDVIGVAVDWDNGKVTFYKNGTSQGDAFTGKDLTGYVPAFYFNTNQSATGVVNFGQRPFTYTPPTDYKSLCTTNLPDPLIADGSTAFDATIYNGTGSSQSITGINHSPDFVWIKDRGVSWSHMLFDTVRGIYKSLHSNATSAEGSNVQYLTAFNSDGFTVGTNATVNSSGGDSYIAWTWDGGNLVTNSAYNQSQAWSTFGDSNAKTNENWTHVFDGNGTAAPHVVANSGSTTVWTPSTPITFTKLEIYANNDGYGDITLNGSISTTGTVPSGGGSSIGWANVTSLISNNTLTSIEVPNSYNSDPTRLGAIKVDDKYLFDPGVIPVGSLNNTTYNQSYNWTQRTTLAQGSGTLANVFDVGNIWPSMLQTGGNAELVEITGFDAPVTSKVTFIARNTDTFTTGSKVVVNVNGTDTNYTVSSTSPNRVVGTTGYWDITVSAGTLKSIQVTGNQGSGRTYLGSIAIDDKQLVDNTINFPSISSTCRANPSAGFSIVTHTGSGTNPSSIGHGLNSAPVFYITKSRDSSTDWIVSTTVIDGTHDFLDLNNTQAAGAFDAGIPTSSVFFVSGSTTNASGDGYVTYCWAPVEGYSAFGKFFGSSTLPFVYCGFRPALIMVKDATSTGWFHVHDTARDPYNVSGARLFWGDSITEQENDSAYGFDILSNGFKLRNTHSESNDAGQTYIWAAWAETPFKTARAR